MSDIAPQVEEVEALRREVERLRLLARNERGLLDAVLNHSPYGVIVCDPQGQLILHNRAAERIWAGSATAKDVESWGTYRAFHPDGRSFGPGDWSMARCLSKGETILSEEVHFQRFDDSHGTLLGSAAPTYDSEGTLTGAVSIFTDITEQVRVRQAAEKVAHDLKTMLEASMDCIIVIDQEGRITDFNPAAERTFQLTREAVLGKEMAELLIPPTLRERHREGLRRYIETGVGPVIGKRIEISALRADGTEFPVELAITPVSSGESLAFMGYLRDITGRHEAEAERKELLAREQAAREAAEVANRTKDDFLATVSHELRTPLNAMLGWTRMLRTGELPEAKRERALEAIERNAVAQTQLIDDLLDVARIISGKLRLDVEPVELAKVVEGAIDSVRPSLDAKELRFHPLLDPKAGPIMGDAARLQQVVWNLLSNAVKFTPKGGRIQLTLERINSHIELTVTDSGLGIKPDFIPYVFERFKQADATNSRSHTGLGLGLAIARHIIELHGGTIAVHSEGVGQGTSFSLTLPVASVRYQSRDASFVHPVVGPGPTFDHPPELVGLKVLIVDDEEDARELLRAVLEQCGAIVTSVPTPADALAAMADQRPDVLISDIGMPGEDGYSFIRRVRLLPVEKGGAVPAAAATAYARAEDRKKAFTAGFQMHIPKPVEPAELVAIVANLARISRAMR